MKERIRIILAQIVIVSFFMFLGLVVSGIISGVNRMPLTIEWHLPLSMFVTAILTSIPTLILTGGFANRLHAAVRIAAHFITLYAIVMCGGYFFKWYDGLADFVVISAEFAVIYIVVWVYALLKLKHDEQLINGALDKMRDDD